MKEYKDSKGEWRYTVKADNGQITAASSEGYKNRVDMAESAINSSLDILEYYFREMDFKQRERFQYLYDRMKYDNINQ